MKCPLMLKTWQSKPDEMRFGPMNCLEEECAWWREDIRMCSVRDLSLELGYTQHRLSDIIDMLKKWGR